MKEPSKEDLLKWFDEICIFLSIHGFTKRDERAVAIGKLIKNKPKVTKKEIFDFHGNLMTIVEDEDNFEELEDRERRYIEQWLKKIGLEVEE